LLRERNGNFNAESSSVINVIRAIKEITINYKAKEEREKII
jgi:hypothetical protein